MTADTTLSTPGASSRSDCESRLVLELARMFARAPGMAERLSSTHVDDGSGYCAGCDQQFRPRWPCVIFGLTAQACAAGTKTMSKR
ncbi:MAG: hypothetical protein ACT4RN_14370 [Pseudonocardia sp.]